MSVALSGNDLTFPQLYDVTLRGEQVQLTASAIERMKASRAVVERLVASGATAYGINTGFGKLASVRISPEQVRQLQVNLVRSHACGLGAPLSEAETRAMMVLRANALAKGLSGVRPQVVESLCQMLNAKVHPVIPSQGSVGASGDLAPLAHLAQVVIGEGRATFRGEVLPGGEAMKRAGITPVALEAKEGLSLLNGTQGVLALLSLALREADILVDTADVEFNSATDNPLVFVRDASSGDIISGGNFHGQPLAMAADQVAIAIATLGGIVERRVEQMTNPLTSMLPAFLTPEPGVNSGLMVAQITAAALTSENKALATPHSVDSISTSGNQEDYVSMGMTGARRLQRMLENLRHTIAIELLCACQGIDLLAPLQTGALAKKAYQGVRGVSHKVSEDRPLAADIKALSSVVADGTFSVLLR